MAKFEEKSWAIGDGIADMHYGIEKVKEKYDVLSHERFDLLKEDMPRRASYGTSPSEGFLRFLQSFNSSVGNKILMLIDYPHEGGGYWTAAYQYDGIFAGIVKLRKREAL